jgi:hypothetical protein
VNAVPSGVARGAFVAIDVSHFAELAASLRDNKPEQPYEHLLFEVASANSVSGRFTAKEADSAPDNESDLLRVSNTKWDDQTMRLCGCLTLAVGDTVYAPSWDANSNSHTSALYPAEVVERPQKRRSRT